MSLYDDASLIAYPSGYKESKIYAQKPVSGTGDLTFTRASSATRVNAEGLIETVTVFGSELIVNGDFATDSDWTKGTGWTIGSGVANANNVPNLQRLQNAGGSASVIGSTYKYSLDVSNVSGFYSVYVYGVYVLATVNTEGTIEGYVTATSTNGAVWVAGATAGGLVSAKIDNVSVKEVITSNVPRIDYTGGGCGSLLLEPQRTNLITYSNDFSQWTQQSGVTPTYNTTETLSPDGTYNSTKFIGNGSAGVLNAAITVTGVITRSIYLKSVTGTVNVILKDPNITITSKSLTVTTEWQRFDLAEDNGTSSQGIWISSIPISGVYMYGGQIEASSYPTSYIPTSGATVTRLQDTSSTTGLSSVIGQTEGTIYGEFNFKDHSTGTRRLLCLTDGTTSNRITTYVNTADSISVYIVNGGAAQADIVGTVLTEGVIKYAVSYASNTIKLFLNGTLVGSDTSATIPATSNFYVGTENGNSPSYFNWQNLMVFPSALTDDELADLTGAVHQTFNSLATFYNYTIL